MGFFDWLKRIAGDTDGPTSAPEAPDPLAPDPPPAGAASVPAASAGDGRGEGKGAPDLSLDASAFAPLSARQFRSQALSAREAVHRAWFTRRDRIPPTTDESSLLIERAMVGQGLITPEDLAEIHRLGEAMDELRPYLELAVDRGERAVAADRAEKARIKAQKKEAAAERQRLHAEAVARRRATEIDFLGRGVSDGLGDRRANVERLQQLGLPLLASPADVAAALELSVPRLRWLTYHSEAVEKTHYVRFSVPKRGGGERALAAPMPELRRCQRWILGQILDRIPLHPAAHGFCRGRSTVTNARPHCGARLLVNMDLRDFFPSVTFPRVRGVFRHLGYSPAAATVLALLCCEAPRKQVRYAGRALLVATGAPALPQGAPTSPALSNLVSRHLDARLSGIAGRLGWTYSRYADDLSFSCREEAAADKVAYLMARVRHIARDEGFAVNEEKTRVLRPSAAQTVTGVVVNQRPGAPRKLVRRVRAILHRARFEGLTAQNREGIDHFEAWLGGTIAYISMLNPDQGAPLRRDFEALKK